MVRTTLDIDDDVLQAAKELADFRGLTAGKVLSDLARRGMTPITESAVRNGVPVLPRQPGRRAVSQSPLSSRIANDYSYTRGLAFQYAAITSAGSRRSRSRSSASTSLSHSRDGDGHVSCDAMDNRACLPSFRRDSS